VLRRIFRPKREEDGLWRKLLNDELCNLYSSPNIIRVIKSRRMRWAGHVGHMGEGFGGEASQLMMAVESTLEIALTVY
jgi:hypothetical protein